MTVYCCLCLRAFKFSRAFFACVRILLPPSPAALALLCNLFPPPSTRVSAQAVIFDEVDGMAGNEDRGGVGEILRLIKSTKMPIICIANDVPQKLRRLRDIAFHLPFRKLQTKQIRSAMMSVAYKEGGFPYFSATACVCVETRAIRGKGGASSQEVCVCFLFVRCLIQGSPCVVLVLPHPSLDVFFAPLSLSLSVPSTFRLLLSFLVPALCACRHLHQPDCA